MLGHQPFGLRVLNHFRLQPFDLLSRWCFVDKFNVFQNVPPPMPFKAVKSVNLPAAGVVRPMVESLMTELSMLTFEIAPPVITM